MNLPPSLAWLPKYVESTKRALGESMIFECNPTVNPLVYQVRVIMKQNMSPDQANCIWNMLQIWASKNDCVPYGKLSKSTNKRLLPTLAVYMVIKKRLGVKMEESP